MRNILILCLIISLCVAISPVFADSLVCDPQAGVTDYRVQGLDPARTDVNAQPDGSVKYDVSTLAPGQYNGTIQAGARYTLNGSTQPAIKWSDPPTPFDLGVPDTPAGSSGMAVTKD